MSIFIGKVIKNQEWVICPECETTQAATVEASPHFPFAAYIHDCSQCGYTIMESEWNEVEAPQVAFCDPNQLTFDFTEVMA